MSENKGLFGGLFGGGCDDDSNLLFFFILIIILFCFLGNGNGFGKC